MLRPEHLSKMARNRCSEGRMSPMDWVFHVTLIREVLHRIQLPL